MKILPILKGRLKKYEKLANFGKQTEKVWNLASFDKDIEKVWKYGKLW